MSYGRKLTMAMVLVGLLGACERTPGQATPQAVTARARPQERTLSFVPRASRPEVLSPGSAPRSSAVASARATPLWLRARTRDPAALARLAEEEGGASLVRITQEGGEDGHIALLALPLATDALAYAGALCQLLPRVVLGERWKVLQALSELLARERLGELAELHTARQRCEAPLRSLEPPLSPQSSDFRSVALAYL